MKAVSLNAFPRSQARRAGSKRLREGGRVPAVIYGRNATPANLELDLEEFEEVMHHSASETILVDLAVRGETETLHLAFVRQIQHHPLSGKVLHVDFHQVSADEPVTVTLPVESTGEAEGVKAGGVLEHVRFSVKVRGLPKDLPEVIEVDVAHLQIGQAVHLGEIKLPAGVRAVGDPNIPVIAVAAPITEAQEQATLEAATAPLAEPEMIKEKKDEAGAEGAEPAAKGKAEAKPAEKGEKTPDKAAEKPAEKKK